MNDIKENKKLKTQNKERSKYSLNNNSLNKINSEIMKNNSTHTLSNSIIKKNKNKVLSPNKIKNLYNLDLSILKNIKENKIKDYNNSGNYRPLYSDNNRTRNNKSYKDSLLYIRNRKNYSNIFKKYFLGNDIILPFNTINDFNYSNKNFYTYNDFDKNSRCSLIKSNSKTITIEKDYMSNKSNKTLSNKKKSNKIKNSSKILIVFKGKKNPEYLNKNIEADLYDLIEINHFSNKMLKVKTLNNKNKLNFKDNSTNLKNCEFINNPKRKKLKKNLQINKIINNNKINNICENNKNEEFDKSKNLSSYNIAKRLIEDPNSFIYLMFNRIKNQQFDEEGNLKKLDLQKRFSEYKKDLNKLEQKARFELFNLKKERAIGNEINMKGRVISTNSFFNLAFGGY